MYSELRTEVERGRAGDNVGIEITLTPKGEGEMSGYSRLARSFSFGPKKYVSLGAPGGVGKTSFTLYKFVFVPIWMYLKGLSKFNPYFIYHLTERQRVYAEAKILAMIIYHADKVIYDVPTMLQQGNRTRELNDDDLRRFDQYGKDLDKVLRHIHWHMGSATLESMDLIQKDHFQRVRGKDVLVGHFTDHVNNITQEGVGPKEILDTHSDRMKFYRDEHNWFCFDISQFSREIENDYRVLKRGVRVKKSDWFGSSKFQMNCDLMLGMVDPRDYDVNKYQCDSGDKEYYDMTETTNDYGYNRFRALWIAKNSDGMHSRYIPLAFAGECGVSSELPDAGDMDSRKYDKVRSGMFI